MRTDPSVVAPGTLAAVPDRRREAERGVRACAWRGRVRVRVP